jgi:hypothetical protein
MCFSASQIRTNGTAVETGAHVKFIGTGFTTTTTTTPDGTTTNYPALSIADVTATVKSVSSDGTSLVADLLVKAGATRGARAVTVINPDGGRSTLAGGLTLADVPVAPTDVAVALRTGAARVTWTFPTAPGSDGGQPLTGFRVDDGNESTDNAVTVGPDARTADLTGLTDGTTYTFTVVATNRLGDSAPGTVTGTPAPVTALHPLANPTRLLDTRTGTGAPKAAVGPNGTLTLQITGRGGIPASGVSAVVLNVTAVSPSKVGYLTVWPNGVSRPTASTLNFVPRGTVANLVVVPVGSSGRVRLFNGSNGTVQLVADASGWYNTGAAQAPGSFGPLTPARLLDTRNGTGAARRAVVSGRTVALQVGGRGGVPSNAGAVILNVTATAPTAKGYVTVWPSGTTRPTASNLNFVAGQTVADLVVVPLAPGGAVDLYNGSPGTVQLVADVAGYIAAGAPQDAGTFGALSPSRLLDTRTDGGAVPAGGTRTVQVLGRGGVPATGVSAVFFTLTVVSPTAIGYLTAWPTGATRPTASNLNFAAGQTVPNLVVVPVGADGTVSLYNGSSGSSQMLADVAGYTLS